MAVAVRRTAAWCALALAVLGPVSTAAQQKPDTSVLRVGGATATVVTGEDGKLSAAGRGAVIVDGPSQTPPPARATQPATDSLVLGGRTIPAGAVVAGPVVVAGGDLVVEGTVTGSAVAIAGDVVIRNGGRVTGDAIAAFGEVHREGGTVGGVTRSLTGRWGESLRSSLRGDGLTPTQRSPFQLALGWFGVMMLIGLGVLVFASRYMDGVVDVLQESFWRSFFVGIAGELGVLPAILLVVVGLAITVIGVLLIPFAVVAVVLAVAGLATLGFVAVAQLTGNGIGARAAERLSQRGGALRGVVVGIALYMGLWLLATAVGATGIEAVAVAARVVAILVTYVAVTAGFGAAILSRGGTRRDAAVTQAPAPAMNAASWQTPTPVTGVVAARRPAAKATAELGGGGKR